MEEEDIEEINSITKLEDYNIGHKYLFRTCLLGDAGVGKTSILTRFCDNSFKESYNNTIGVDFRLVTLQYKDIISKLHIWDTAGQERFKSMSVQVIKTSDAVILVYSVNDKKSFNALDMWLNKLSDSSDLSKKPIVIIGNKSDIEQSKRVISYEEGKQYADSKGYHFYETSAKTGENVEKAFYDIFEQLYTCFEEEITGKSKYNKGVTLYGQKDKKKRFC